ncbi:hypothetical protein BTA51_29370 [Hahella sp. CCB-MM4]|nr:hypothetical protein BTA51_29370 [Hahella sp. CCB-MM4]
MSTDQELIQQGLKLIAALEEKGSYYHAKSSMHDSFMWEAVGIKTRIESLVRKEQGARDKENVDDTTFGEGLREFSPELADEVSGFYKRYYGTGHT